MDTAWAELVALEWQHQCAKLSGLEGARLGAWIVRWQETPDGYLAKYYAAVARGDMPVSTNMAPVEG